jgi:hypothetical protein
MTLAGAGVDSDGRSPKVDAGGAVSVSEFVVGIGIGPSLLVSQEGLRLRHAPKFHI